MSAEDAGMHCIHCALLHTARQLLSSGLADVLATCNSTTASSRDLCRQVAFCVHAAWPRTISVLPLLMARLGVSETRRSLPSSSSSSGGRGADADAQCTVTAGRHGRQLTARAPLPRGATVLQDVPFAAVAAAPCGCRAGPLLVEHVALAVDIFHRHERDRVVAFAPPLPSDLNNPAAGPPFARFVRHVQSGLSGPGQGPGPVQASEEGEWDVDQQRLMAAVAAVACCFYSSAGDTGAADASLPVSAVFQADCWALMQVRPVARLEMRPACGGSLTSRHINLPSHWPRYGPWPAGRRIIL